MKIGHWPSRFGADRIHDRRASARHCFLSPANGGTSVSNPASHYSFRDTGAKGVDPKTGVQIADVWGDATKGAYGAFFRFDPGFASHLHTHTYDYYAVVIKGDLENYRPGEKPEKLGARFVHVSAR